MKGLNFRLKIFCVPFFYLIFLILLCKCEKPQILSKYENVLEAGDNFTILCEANSPITWTWPDLQDSVYKEWTTIEIFDEKPTNSVYKYASGLFIQNATFVYTGFYKCFDNNTGDQSETYLYIRDDEHLSVKESEVEVFLGVQFSDAIIPCKPTSPDVTVELLFITGEVVLLDTILEDGSMYRYDPHYGFITNQTRLLEQKLFQCSFKKGSREAMTTIIIDIEPKTFSLPKPLLREISDACGFPEEKLVLQCSIRAPTIVTFEWTTPTGLPDLKRMDLSPIMRDTKDSSLITQWLTVNRSVEDNGTYYCQVSDNQNHQSIATLDVKVCEHFIDLKEENVSRSSAQVGSSFQWHIHVRGNPKPTLFWLNNNNEVIPEGLSEKYATTTTSSETALKILNVTYNDFGRYTLIAVNSFDKKSLVFFLNRDDEPVVTLEGSK